MTFEFTLAHFYDIFHIFISNLIFRIWITYLLFKGGIAAVFQPWFSWGTSVAADARVVWFELLDAAPDGGKAASKSITFGPIYAFSARPLFDFLDSINPP